MNTITLTLPIVANFLRTDQKKPDWRYETWDELANQTKEKQKPDKTIHWIGVIQLSRIPGVAGEEITSLIQYMNNYGELQYDSYTKRHMDGAPQGSNRTQFYLTSIKESLIQAKKSNFEYYNVLLEERVTCYGKHTVSLLFNTDKNGSPIHGIPTNKEWYKLSFLELMSNAQLILSENMNKKVIVSNPMYNWMK